MMDFHCHISVKASESGGGTTERGAIWPHDCTSGCVPPSCESVNPTDSRCCPGPSTVEGRSHVGSCCGDQGSPGWCGPEEEEGPRRPGHGLPGHLQRCYDSGVCSVCPRANMAPVCVCVCMCVAFEQDETKWLNDFPFQTFRISC